MIVEDQPYRRVRRVGSIEQLEELDELAAAMAVLDQGMHLAGDEVDPGQQANGAVALVLELARNGRVPAGLGQQIRSGRGDRLKPWLLVIGDDRYLVVRAALFGGCLLKHLDLAVDAQHLRHLGFEVRVASFQVVAHLVRLHFLGVEDLAHRTLDQSAQAVMTRPRSMLTSVAGQKPRRPQLMRIAEVLRLPAGQCHYPRLRLDRDVRLLAAEGDRPATPSRQPLQPAQRSANGLIAHAQRLAHGIERGIALVGQQRLIDTSPSLSNSRRSRSRSGLGVVRSLGP